MSVSISRSPLPALDRLGVAAACGAASAAVASAFPRAAAPGVLGALALGSAASFLATWHRGCEATEPKEPKSAWVTLAVFVFFIPMLTMAVPPGADMAMHVALARPMIQGESILSPAWGTFEAHYPRGFSGLVAVASLALGLARAGLLVSGVSYVLFGGGMALVLRHAFGLRHALGLAAATLLLSGEPQAFFGWGGNPNVLALALGLFAAGLIASVAAGRLRASIGSPLAALLMVGAVGVHPMGAVASAMAVVGVWLVALARRQPEVGSVTLAAGLALAAFAGAMLLAQRLGPHLSESEVAGILDYGRGIEAVVRGPKWLFFLRVWKGLYHALQGPMTFVLAIAAAFELRWAQGRRRVAWFAGFAVSFGLLLRLGPDIPVVGTLLYPLRLTLLFPVAAAAFVGRALENAGDLRVRGVSLFRALALPAAVAAAAVNLRAYQLTKPIATRNDVSAIECLAATAPPGSIFGGSYGDATQWIPALAGFVALSAHQHCTVADEVGRILGSLSATHFFVGERTVYPPAEPVPKDLGRPLCQVGKAVAFELPRR
jgi:hypothetical protein